jgi:acetate---CoA ligase (ADP-forming)
VTILSVLRPRSVAIVGASGRPGNRFARPLHYLRRYGFQGAIYPVSDKYTELAGYRCYPNLAAIGEPVDLVCCLVAADRCVGIIEECGRAGARAVVVFASGFAETGAAGVALQARLAEAARAAGVLLLGPNSLGVIHAATGLVLTSSGSMELEGPLPGSVAYVGQSGAIGGVVLQLARSLGVGVGTWVCTGNEVAVTAVEVAAEVVELPDVAVVALYLERLSDGGAYVDLLVRADRLGKRVVVLYAGVTEAGHRAASSHTGALLAPTAALTAASDRYGAIMVRDIAELVHTAGFLSLSGPLSGNRVAVVTSSGGAGTLAADACTTEGLRVDALSEATRKAVAAEIPAYGSARNPVDVTAGLFSLTADNDRRFHSVCRVLADDADVDVVLIVLTNIVGETAAKIAAEIVAAHRAGGVFLVCWLAPYPTISRARTLLAADGIVVVDTIAQAAAMLRGVVPRPDVPPRAPEVPGGVVTLPDGAVTEAAGSAFLAAAGIPTPRSVLVRDAAAVAAAVREVGGRAVLKAQSADIPHKAAVGAIRVGVGESDAERQYARLLADVARHAPDAAVDGVLVQATAPPAVELLVGISRSPGGFPALLTVGLGGAETEVYADTGSILLPVTRDDVLALLRGLRCAPLLFGGPGRPPRDVPAFVDLVLRFARSYSSVRSDDLREIELNPVRVYDAGEGVLALDFLAAWSREG